MSLAYAQEVAELIKLKAEQMNTKSGILAGIACVSFGENKVRDQEAYDSFTKKKWLIKLEIEALKAKYRNLIRLVPTHEDLEDEVWMLRVRFNSMIHAHEIMHMTAGEMERIHNMASSLNGSNLKAYWKAHIANCEKAVVDYRKAETEARSRLIKDVLARKAKDPSAYTVTY
jgi:hypothetical protein